MTTPSRCSLPRRLAAGFYDLLVVVALVMVASVPLVVLAGGAHETSFGFRMVSRAWDLLVAFAFFGGFWRYGGQTIGMRAWRIRLVAAEGERIGWLRVAIRYVVALISWAALGLGFWWGWIDREGLTWHDRASATHLIREPPGN